MVQLYEDLKPDAKAFTPFREIVVVVLVVILSQIEEEPGNVTDNVQDDYCTEGPGRVGETPPVLRYLVLA